MFLTQPNISGSDLLAAQVAEAVEEAVAEAVEEEDLPTESGRGAMTTAELVEAGLEGLVQQQQEEVGRREVSDHEGTLQEAHPSLGATQTTLPRHGGEERQARPTQRPTGYHGMRELTPPSCGEGSSWDGIHDAPVPTQAFKVTLHRSRYGGWHEGQGGAGALSRGARGAEEAKKAAAQDAAAGMSRRIVTPIRSTPGGAEQPLYITTRQFHSPARLANPKPRKGGRRATSQLSSYVSSLDGVPVERPDGFQRPMSRPVSREQGGGGGFDRPITRGTVASTVASGLSEFNTPEGHELWLSGKADHDEVDAPEYLPKVLGRGAMQPWTISTDDNQPVVWH